MVTIKNPIFKNKTTQRLKKKLRQSPADYKPLSDNLNYYNLEWLFKNETSKKSKKKYIPKNHCSTIGCDGTGHIKGSKFTTHYRYLIHKKLILMKVALFFKYF